MDNLGSENGDGDNEKLQAVVLKGGKHPTEKVVQNENEKVRPRSVLVRIRTCDLGIADPGVYASQGYHLTRTLEPSSGSNTTGTATKKGKGVVDLQLQDEDLASLGDMIKNKNLKLAHEEKTEGDGSESSLRLEISNNRPSYNA